MKWLKKNEKILSYLIGLFGILFALYAYFFPIDRPGKLSYILSDSTNVFAVNKPIEELTVLIGNRNIKADSLDLKIFKFRLINNGFKNILPDFYDENIPFGLKVQNGKIINVKIAGSNNDYVKDNILSRYDSTSLILNKIILERKEYVDFEFLITHKNYKIPQFIPFGKISSIKTITIINQIGKERVPFIKRLLKLLKFMGIITAGILVIATLSSFVTKQIEKYRFKSLLKSYKLQHSEVPDSALLLCKLYGKYGKTLFISMSELLLSNEEFQKENELLTQINNSIELMDKWKNQGKVHFEGITLISSLPGYINNLKQNNYIIEEDNTIRIADEMKGELTTILKYLR